MEKMMRFFRDKRRTKRNGVDWNGSLRCIFSDAEQSVPVHICEISMRGARLALERLQLGPYHVLINDQPIEYELSIALPEDPLKVSTEVRWYNWNPEQRVFLVGVEFKSISSESKASLKRAIQNICEP